MAVRLIPVPRLSELQDPETQEKIKGYASIVGKHAAESALHESLKLLPGGYVISNSFNEIYKSSNDKDNTIKELEAEILRLKKEKSIAESTKPMELVDDMEMKIALQNAPNMKLQVYQAPKPKL